MEKSGKLKRKKKNKTKIQRNRQTSSTDPLAISSDSSSQPDTGSKSSSNQKSLKPRSTSQSGPPAGGSVDLRKTASIGHNWHVVLLEEDGTDYESFEKKEELVEYISRKRQRAVANGLSLTVLAFSGTRLPITKGESSHIWLPGTGWLPLYRLPSDPDAGFAPADGQIYDGEIDTDEEFGDDDVPALASDSDEDEPDQPSANLSLPSTDVTGDDNYGDEPS